MWNAWYLAPWQRSGPFRVPASARCASVRPVAPACLGSSFALHSTHYIAHWCANDNRHIMPAPQVAFDRLLGTLVGAFIGVLAFTFAFEVSRSEAKGTLHCSIVRLRRRPGLCQWEEHTCQGAPPGWPRVGGSLVPGWTVFSKAGVASWTSRSGVK